MAWQVFGTLTAGNQNLSLFDTLSGQIAKEVIISCTMTGTNAITLAGTTNAPAITAYSDYVRFTGFPANTTTGVVTARFGSLAFLKVFKSDGSTQATTNDITANVPIDLQYLSTLDTGSGGFYLLSPVVPATSPLAVTVGQAHGLSVTNNAGTPATKIDITAQLASLVTTTGVPAFISSPSVTIDLTTTGANGMDTGSRPTSGWAYCYLIYNGSTTAGLASATSPTSAGPTMPGGYTYRAYCGAAWLDGSQNLFRFKQKGRHTDFVIGTNPTTIPAIASGTQGTYSDSTPTWATPSISNFTPLTASVIYVACANTFGGGTAANVIVAPINAYAGRSSSNPPPVFLNAGGGINQAFSMLLQGTTIAVASSNTGGYVGCEGWDDFYSCG